MPSRRGAWRQGHLLPFYSIIRRHVSRNLSWNCHHIFFHIL
jgi:hypothetical protein